MKRRIPRWFLWVGVLCILTIYGPVETVLGDGLEGIPQKFKYYLENPDKMVALPAPDVSQQDLTKEGLAEAPKGIFRDFKTGKETILGHMPLEKKAGALVTNSGVVELNTLNGIGGDEGLSGKIEQNKTEGMYSFQLINQPWAFPFSTTCLLLLDFGGNIYAASGILIGPAHVLTAGSAIYNHNLGGMLNDALAIPGYINGQAPHGGGYIAAAGLFSPWVYNGDINWNVGLMVLDAAVGYSAGYLGFGYANDLNIYTNWGFNNDAYPNDWMHHRYGTFDGFYTSLMVYVYGPSYLRVLGSGAYWWDTEDTRIVLSVKSASGNGVDFFSIINPTMFNYLYAWIYG